jgi:hypothetical protein
MLCLEGIARALNIFKGRVEAPRYSLADMKGEAGSSSKGEAAAAAAAAAAGTAVPCQHLWLTGRSTSNSSSYSAVSLWGRQQRYGSSWHTKGGMRSWNLHNDSGSRKRQQQLRQEQPQQPDARN